ncbi:MAG TPA: hypothetical protein VFY36_03585 [Solirubrobacteraceae bacterium]|nr:hypothetical protein [Solirubrobacteraceae bacterium]
MTGSRGRRVAVVLTVMVAAVCTWLWARSTATARRVSPPILKIDTKRPGSMFDRGAVGFSTEAGELSRGRLSAAHLSLVRLMRLLGPSVIRIGGNSVDVSWWTSSGEPPPAWATSTVTPAELSVLHGLLRATGWRVLLGVNLGHFEPARAADEARVARRVLGHGLLGIELGNEPDDFGHRQFGLRPSTYGLDEYLSEAETYIEALKAAAPGVAVYGPATTQKAGWLTQMGASGRIFSEITQHYYATSTCPGKPPAVAPTLAGLLSPAERQLEDEVLGALAAGSALSRLPTRIGETNDAACMASAAVSPVFGSALWALDWTLRAGASGVRGLNFHGNLGGVCGANPESPICAESGRAAHDGELTAQPEYYGLLAASRLEGGRFVPTKLTSSKPLPDLTTWATLASDGTLRLALDNLAVSGGAQPISIPMSGYTATVESLAAASPDARRGVTLGRAHVTASGRWRAKPVRVRHRRTLRVVLRPASAVIVTLRPTRRRR